MRNAFPAILLLTYLLPAFAFAETAYVTDNLRLGLHQASDTSDRAFRTLDSGQTLDIISRDRNYANVRLPDGVEGYVKAAYLVFDKPAKLIVAETAAANEALQKELQETKAAFAASGTDGCAWWSRRGTAWGRWLSGRSPRSCRTWTWSIRTPVRTASTRCVYLILRSRPTWKS